MVIKTMNSYVADDLANKVRVLSQALAQTNQMIQTIEEENHKLKDILTNLVSINTKDLDSVKEVLDDRFCTI